MKYSLLLGLLTTLCACTTQITLSDNKPAACSGVAGSGVAGSGVAGSGVGGSDIELGGPDAGNDALGYASFAVSGCALIYVNRAGDLVMRSGTSGTSDSANFDKLLEPAARAPRRPSAKAGLVSWEFSQNGIAGVTVLDQTSGERTDIRGDFHHAGEPRSTGTAIVFTAWSAQSADSDSDVYAFRRGSKVVERIFGGRGQQRFADGNNELFVASDFSEDPTGVFSATGGGAADTLVWREADRVVTTRAMPGKQAFPQLSVSNQVVYLDWGLVRPEPKLGGYLIRTGAALGNPALDVDVQNTSISTGNQMRPAVNGERIAFLNAGSLLVVDPGQAPRAIASGNFLATTLIGESSADKPASQVLAAQRLAADRVVTRLIELR